MKLFRKIIIFLCVITIDFSHFCGAVSMLYNMKIRRIFATSSANIGTVLGRKKKSAWIISAVPGYYQRTRSVLGDVLSTHIDVAEKTKAGGAIFNIRYVPTSTWWVEATTGVGKQTEQVKGTQTFTDSYSGMDDIEICGGHHMFPTKNSQVVVYGLAGFPTHWKVTPHEFLDTFLGTRFFGLGAGLELSYNFLNNARRSLAGILQGRIIHFFNRHWTPILPSDAQIQPGNVTDALLTLQCRQGRSMVEFGYNPTFFTNQAVLLPNETVTNKAFLRNSVYVGGLHLFKDVPLVHKPFVFGAGFNLAQACRYHMKGFSVWLNFTLIL